jgi:hypothetical protein
MRAKILHDTTGARAGVLVQCPGCGCGHLFRVEPAKDPWAWNGSLEKPTFSPSMLVNKDFPESRCHSFVTDGRIQFLDDCAHALRGQTVDLPDIP